MLKEYLYVRQGVLRMCAWQRISP